MLRIIIVDDEILIREGLARMISKESRQFEITGTFADGSQVLEALSGLQVDVVITDIRMPHIDGLELIKRLKATHPQIRCILMSGFVEFNYAREAIRSSAVDYLLKPINKEQLFELLYRLEEERTLQRDKEQRQRSALLLPLIHIEEPSGALLSSLTLPRPYFSVFVLKGDCPEAVYSCTDSLRQEKDAMFDIIEVHKKLHLWVYYSDAPLTVEDMRRIGKHLEAAPGGRRLHMGSSHSYSDKSQLRAAYFEAAQACDNGIYHSDLLYYANIDDIRSSDMGMPEFFTAYRETLIHELQILNVTGVMDSIHQLFSAMKAQQVQPERINQACRLITEIASKELPELESCFGSDLYTQLEDRIRSCMTFDEMKTVFTSAFREALVDVRTQRLEMSSTAVETVKRWVTANYNQQIELNALAQMVFLTPSYLSKLFKQETGLTLTDYLIEIRIRQAKHLLKYAPDRKIHEIGAEVGYSDPAYFNKLFKRVVGVTPNEYKRISV